jgi:NitT/TauT family transport system substrate-binding protein
MTVRQSRRRFLTTLSLAGAASILRARSLWAIEPAPETPTVRLLKPSVGSICVAPELILNDLLGAEGFNDVRYIAVASNDLTAAVGAGTLDFALNFASSLTNAIDRHVPIIALAGIHAGCFGLFGHEGVGGIADLKGKSVAVQAMGGDPGYLFVAVMAAEVGIDPRKDIRWVTAPGGKSMDLFVDGKVDAFLGFPPQPQELRDRHIGHLVVDSAVDRPWSQYFCCLLYGNADYVQKYPVATKRVVRAVLKATDICASQPETVARQLVDDGAAQGYDRVLQVLRELPYDRWREYDPEDTMRYYALRLHEVGLIKSTPNNIIAQGTNWRFLDELKRELKA